MHKYQLAISIVSHRHGHLLPSLLLWFNSIKDFNFQLILTINSPENESFLNLKYSYPLSIIRNKVPFGFGHNHNNAFNLSEAEFFLILNPDVVFTENYFPDLLNYMSNNPEVGISTGVVRNASGSLEDNLRFFPSYYLVFKRFFLRLLKFDVYSDYDLKDVPFNVDWVAGLFILISSKVYKKIGGFDQNYFMYYEDADLCIRCRISGYSVICYPKFNMIHSARRSSFKRFNHLKWHILSVYKVIKIVNRIKITRR